MKECSQDANFRLSCYAIELKNFVRIVRRNVDVELSERGLKTGTCRGCDIRLLPGADVMPGTGITPIANGMIGQTTTSFPSLSVNRADKKVHRPANRG
jgi:hypothetical protein